MSDGLAKRSVSWFNAHAIEDFELELLGRAGLDRSVHRLAILQIRVGDQQHALATQRTKIGAHFPGDTRSELDGRRIHGERRLERHPGTSWFSTHRLSLIH